MREGGRDLIHVIYVLYLFTCEQKQDMRITSNVSQAGEIIEMVKKAIINQNYTKSLMFYLRLWERFLSKSPICSHLFFFCFFFFWNIIEVHGLEFSWVKQNDLLNWILNPRKLPNVLCNGTTEQLMDDWLWATVKQNS